MRETRPVIVIGDACVDVTVRLADLMVGHSDVFDSERLLPTISGGGTSANTAVAKPGMIFSIAPGVCGTGHRHGADHCG